MIEMNSDRIDEANVKEVNGIQIKQMNQDSEANLALPNEYEKEPNMIHLEDSEKKQIRKSSLLNMDILVRYSFEENNVNSPLNKSQKL